MAHTSALFIEGFELCLVEIAEAFFGDSDDIPVPVSALTGDGVDFGVVACRGDWDGDVPVEDTDGSEDGVVNKCTRVVGEALIAGNIIEVVGAHLRVKVDRVREEMSDRLRSCHGVTRT